MENNQQLIMETAMPVATPFIKFEKDNRNWLDKEVALYQAEENIIVPKEKVQLIVNKICRHFKLNSYRVKFWGLKENGGRIHYFDRIVRVAQYPCMATICHEFTHPLCRIKYPKRRIRHGCKKWKLQMSRIIKYARSKNFWGVHTQ